MQLTFRFLDIEKWSLHGTLRTVIPFLLFLVLKLKLNVKSLVLMSLLGMMKGSLLSKLIMTCFINFMIYEPTKQWLINFVVYLISVLLMDRVTFENDLEKMIYNNGLFMWIFRLIIIIWMGYILHKIILPFNKWNLIMKMIYGKS